MKEKLIRFMNGRYGGDELSKFTLAVCLVFIILNYFIGIRIISSIVFVLLILNLFRIFSRNINARYRENQKYLELKGKVLNFFRSIFNKQNAADKTKRIFKCPSCRQKVRVPKGRGRIAITCPKCKTQFIKRT